MIATFQYDGVGARIYTPTGPQGASGNEPTLNFKPGEVVRGDCEAEYVFLTYVTTGSKAMQQGDALVWDDSYQAIDCLTSTCSRGMSFGTFFCGGRFGDPAANPFSVTLASAGVYGIWAQRSGTSMLNAKSTAANANLAETSTTAKTIDAPASPTATSKKIAGLYITPATTTFVADDTSGSNLLTNLTSVLKNLVVGATISGTGIPTGTVITAVSGSSVTMSNAATSSNAGITVTITRYSAYGTTLNGSPTLTNLTTTNNFYPGQTIAGTGIPASTTIVSINGNPGNFSITMSANATASANSINFTTTLFPEAYLKTPYIDLTN